MPEGTFQPSKKFKRTFKFVKYLRRFEVLAVLSCALLLLIAIATFTADRFDSTNIVIELLYTFVDGRIFSILSIVWTFLYSLLLALRLLAFDFFADLYEDEMERLKGSAQAYSGNQIPEDIQDMVEDFQRYSRPMLGDSRKAVMLNLIASFIFAIFYLAFVFKFLK